VKLAKLTGSQVNALYAKLAETLRNQCDGIVTHAASGRAIRGGLRRAPCAWATRPPDWIPDRQHAMHPE